jgi:hypothetical protein
VTEADRQPPAGDGTLPAIDFSTFVMSLSHSVLVHLGDAPDPEGARTPHLELARQTIDLLALLQEKTRNNLTGPEEQLLGQALYDLRTRYVEVSRAKSP